MESVARIGSYSLDVRSGGWSSSRGLDAIFGIDAAFDRSVETWAGLVHPGDRAAVVAYFTDEVLGRGCPFDRQYRIVRADTREDRWVHGCGALEFDATWRPVTMFGTIADITDQRSAQEALVPSEFRYAAIFEGTAEAILMAELATQRYRWVNPAACALLGYSRDELLGLTVHDIHPPADLPWILEAFRSAGDGRVSEARSVPCLRKDGSVLLADIRGSTALVEGVSCNIAFFTDVTELRRLEAQDRQLAQAVDQTSEAILITGPTGRIAYVNPAFERLSGSPGEDIVGGTPNLLGNPQAKATFEASIINFVDAKRAIPLAAAGPDGLPIEAGRPLPAARAQYLHERATQGPWAEAFRARPVDARYGEAMVEIGIRASAYAPIQNGEGLLGLVMVGTRDEAYARHLTDHLPLVGEFAATASALLSGQLERGHRDARTRERIARVRAEHAFRPVYQPTMTLASGEPVGYEALTRFADGTPPDRMIADAHAVGLGLDIEIACIAAALEASDGLLPGCWLSLNASPEVILQRRKLAALLAGRSRRIVLEVTEHVEIDHYPAVRRAIAGFGPSVSLAVDDAGAGFASLRHVVELSPRFLKLDISLVRHVDRDVTRQAMIAGLREFAGRVGCTVIAEGIEEPAELRMLRELGVPLGQGYLLGRPEALPTRGSDGRPTRPARRVRQPVSTLAGAHGAGPSRRRLSRAPRDG